MGRKKEKRRKYKTIPVIMFFVSLTTNLSLWLIQGYKLLTVSTVSKFLNKKYQKTYGKVLIIAEYNENINITAMEISSNILTVANEYINKKIFRISN